MMYIRLITPGEESVYYRVKVEFSSMNSEVYEQIRAAIARKTSIPPNEQDLRPCEEPTHVEGAQVQDLILLPEEELVQRLQNEYPELFGKSVVYVDNLDVWSSDSIFKPENRVQFFDELDQADTGIQNLREDLHRPRQVDRAMSERFQSFLAGIQATGIQDFVVVSEAQGPPSYFVTATEMESYDYIFHHIEERCSIIQKDHRNSSALHSSVFTTLIMQPPFLWDNGVPESGRLKIIQERGSHIRVLVKPDDSSAPHACSPKSDVAVLSTSEDNLPVLISEIDSNIEKEDRTRMILQGVVICRQRRYLLLRGSEKTSILLGLYVHENFLTDLYFFRADVNDKVSILKETFDLTKSHRALLLARCLFNYRDKLLQANDRYGTQQTSELASFFKESHHLPSYTTEKKRTSKSGDGSSKRRHLEPVPGQSTDALLLSEELQSLMSKSNTCIEPTKREHVAAVKTKAPPHHTVGFVKIMNDQELYAFAAIRASGSSLLLDRVVLPIKTLVVSARWVAFLPYGGEPLHRARNMRDGTKGHELRIAWDILNIFSRLHELRIAHLDIKPANILWHPFFQSIRVIDFDSSVILGPHDSCNISGVAGTIGYTAPEVRKGGEYDALLADAFSCGVVLAEVMGDAVHSKEKEFVRELTKALRREAGQRWTTCRALEAWKDWRDDDDDYRMQNGFAPDVCTC